MKVKEKKQPKPRVPRKCFAERLAEKLKPMGHAEYDQEGEFVILVYKDMKLEFSVDSKGEHIDGVSLFQLVYDVVDERKIHSFYLPPSTPQP